MTGSERDVASRWFEEVWNQGRREAIAEMLAPGALVHDGDTDSIGPEGFYPFFDRIRATFSDFHINVDDTIAEGDKVCLRWSCTAKHTGSGLGIPPTGKMLRVTGMTIMRIAGGMLAEGWQNWDMLGLIEQITGSGKAATYISAKT